MEEGHEWEDQFVFVELIGMVDPDKLSICTTANTDILGVDSDMTVLKLGGYAFAGHYEDTLGTMVLFEETEDKKTKSLKYLCHTTKVLKTSRAFLKLKNRTTDNEESWSPNKSSSIDGKAAKSESNTSKENAT